MTSIPPWLQESVSNTEHIQLVLRTLQKRENERVKARVSSNHALTNPSQPQPNNNSVIHKKYSVAIGTRPENLPRNRYLDVEPYDVTRVVCNGQACTNDPYGSSSFYLNASWVRERAGGRWWIASQATLPHTAHDFLSIIMQSQTIPPTGTPTPRVRTVVQLTRTIEGGRRKADIYFPTQVGQAVIVTPDGGAQDSSYKVTLQQQQVVENVFVKSTVSIIPLSQPTSEPVVFNHLLYPSWPDHGVPEPEDRKSLLSFLHLVEKTNEGSPELPLPPIIIGCSAGIGRTGAYIALTSLLRSYGLLSIQSSSSLTPLPDSPLGPMPPELQDDLVAQEIDSLREQRPGMVQRAEQALLVYEMLLAAFTSEKNN